jgi:hypothetical protein
MRTPISALSMEEPLLRNLICSGAREIILKRNSVNTVNVGKAFLRIQTSVYIKKFILQGNTFNVLNVERPSQENQH